MRGIYNILLADSSFEFVAREVAGDRILYVIRLVRTMKYIR